jgi:hypothetical protein
MDNIQKAALIALMAVGFIVSVYVVHTVNSESARVEAERQAEEEHSSMCDEWSYAIENMRAELDGRQDSLGGALDLDGSVGVFRNQFNLDVDRYNSECANVETNYYGEYN